MAHHEAREAAQDGFTLIELLVVMIIIGVLAAIAIPIFLNQRGKAHDASTKADVSRLGKEIATYYVDQQGAPSLDFTSTPGSVIVNGGTQPVTVKLTNGTAEPITGAYTNLNDPKNWCVSLTDSNGFDKDFKYSGQSGLSTGTCP